MCSNTHSLHQERFWSKWKLEESLPAPMQWCGACNTACRSCAGSAAAEAARRAAGRSGKHCKQQTGRKRWLGETPGVLSLWLAPCALPGALQEHFFPTGPFVPVPQELFILMKPFCSSACFSRSQESKASPWRTEFQPKHPCLRTIDLSIWLVVSTISSFSAAASSQKCN